MTTNKQKLTPKVKPPETTRPTRGSTKGRPKVNPTRRDNYICAVLSGLLSRTPHSLSDAPQVKEEAEAWADFMLDEE